MSINKIHNESKTNMWGQSRMQSLGILSLNVSSGHVYRFLGPQLV